MIVRVLALYLFWKGWRNRPSPEPPAWTALAIVVIIFAAALFLPIRFIAEANPDWRLLCRLLAIVVTTMTLSFLYLIGGRGGVSHLSFSFFFFLVSGPRPVRIQALLLHGLRRIFPPTNVQFLHLSGLAPLQ